MRPRAYSFAARWPMAAHPDACFAVLADLAHYDVWWPQVRALRQVDDDTAAVEARSTLPYTLQITLHRVREDPATRRLVAAIDGDLRGWASWRVRGALNGSTVEYGQEVVTTAPWMNRVGPLLAPVFRLNHATMMRAARRGLAAQLRDSSPP